MKGLGIGIILCAIGGLAFYPLWGIALFLLLIAVVNKLCFTSSGNKVVKEEKETGIVDKDNDPYNPRWGKK